MCLRDGVSDAVISKSERFQPLRENRAGIFLIHPQPLSPHTATSNGLIGLLHKCGEIKIGESDSRGGGVEMEEVDRGGVNGLITA